MDNNEIKQRTLDLYASLPMNKADRMLHTEVRDEVIDLNYSFFGYVATSTFINNSSITYEDKLQSALMHFCECWWWYKWDGTGDPKHKGYRQDLSFTSFYKLRIGEMIERELNEVKYSVRRDLCMEAGKQLGKHWGKVTYDDLKHVEFESDKQGKTNKLASLKAIFGSMYIADLETHALFTPDTRQKTSIIDELNDNYNTIEEFLIREMIDNEGRLTDDDLKKLSNDFQIPYDELHRCLPKAEKMLHDMLVDKVDINSAFLEE